MYFIAWLVLFVILLVFELITMGLVSIWFAIGALAAALVAAIGANWLIQALVFIGISVLVLIFIRPFAANYINNHVEKTNVESIVGKSGKVTCDIDNVNASGTVVIDGMDWTARSAQGEIIKAGATIEVLSVEGVKVIVKEK